jgi:hypothetical protein
MAMSPNARPATIDADRPESHNDYAKFGPMALLIFKARPVDLASKLHEPR